jgi:hypothetical protein
MREKADAALRKWSRIARAQTFQEKNSFEKKFSMGKGIPLFLQKNSGFNLTYNFASL